MTATARIDEDPRREKTVAVGISVLLHLLVIGGIAWVSTAHFRAPEPAPIDEEPLEFTIINPEPSTPAPPQFVRTNPAAAQPDAPKNAPFESDNNTRAASESPATGAAPMPSVAGRESTSLELENRDYTAGAEARPSAPTAPPSPEQAAQEPAPPTATPTPTTQLALRQAPPKTEDRPPAEKPKPAQPTTAPRPPAAPGFQPETRVTRIRGNISNRGKASLEAAATPLGRYKKMVSDAIGSRWYYYVNNQIGLLNIGTVDIRFIVQADGKVRNVRVTSNSSNESFASVSVNSIIEAEIPPIPEEVAKLLDNGRLEIDYSFTILSN